MTVQASVWCASKSYDFYTLRLSNIYFYWTLPTMYKNEDVPHSVRRLVILIPQSKDMPNVPL